MLGSARSGLGLVAVETLSATEDIYEDVLYEVLSDLKACAQGEIATTGQGKIDKVIVRHESPDILATNDGKNTNFESSLMFAQALAHTFNQHSRDPLQVVVVTGPLYMLDDGHEWRKSQQTYIGLKHVNTSGIRILRGADFYLRKLADGLFAAFMQQFGLK